jgi:hypothetical protein
MIKKIIKTTIPTLALVLGLSTSAFADWGPADSWSSWAPYSGSAYTYTSGTTGGCTNDTIKVRASSIKYDSTAVSAIKSLYSSEGWYPGLDVTTLNYGDHMDASYITSNYPNPKYDTDNDDGDAANNAEESEVTSMSPGSMSTSTSYYYYVDFDFNYSGATYDIHCGGSGTIEITAHESDEVWWSSEMQTADYDVLDSLSWSTK